MTGGRILLTRVWRRVGRPVAWVSSASRPASTLPASWAGVVSVLAMAADLPTQFFGDLTGQFGHGRVLDATRLRDVDRPLARDPAGAGGQQDHALRMPYGLADVVCDEQDGDPGLGPDPGDLVVQHVPRDGVEGRERLVPQQQGALPPHPPGPGH